MRKTENSCVNSTFVLVHFINTLLLREHIVQVGRTLLLLLLLPPVVWIERRLTVLSSYSGMQLCHFFMNRCQCKRLKCCCCKRHLNNAQPGWDWRYYYLSNEWDLQSFRCRHHAKVAKIRFTNFPVEWSLVVSVCKCGVCSILPLNYFVLHELSLSLTHIKFLVNATSNTSTM